MKDDSKLRVRIAKELLSDMPELSGKDLQDAIDDELAEREFDAACFCTPDNGWFSATSPT